MESQDSSIPSVLTKQDTISMKLKKALDQPLLNIGVKRLTMELNTGDITVVYYQWKEDAGGNLDGMWRGSSVEFFLPSIASSIYTNYDNLTGFPGSNSWLRSAKTGRTDGR
jgi:hypothetical protein